MRALSRELILGVCLVLSFAGCECSDPGGRLPDAGTDGGNTDGGGTDGGGTDGGDTDGGGTDGGGTDGGGTDGGGTDGGGTDGGGTDGGGTDGGGTDGGVTELSCAVLCHGDEESGAPPLDLRGGSLTSATEVGAHRSHLVEGSDWHRDVVCEDCHLVPIAVGDVGHIDTPRPAELTWGGVPLADGASPVWDRLRCDGVYCHGVTLHPGGTNTTPEWTTVDGSQAACGTCHALPPQAPHPVDTDCSRCHPTIDTDGLTFLEPQRHVDGTVDLGPLGCTSCHGDPATGPAPPADTTGGVDTSLRGVGAHASHLAAGSGWHRDLKCTDCHLYPAALDSPGHIDTPLPAELTWGAVPLADAAAPTFTAGSCDNYCHGQTLLPGGSETTPVWTTVDGSQASCGTCHGLPPAYPHPARFDCQSCHPDIGAGFSFLEPDRHVDGVVDLVPLQCNTCHGGATSDAPPVDTTGNASTALTSVGAHQSHLGTSSWHREVQCDACHRVPLQWTDPGHVDTPLPAELTWGGLPLADGAAPTFIGGSCDNYCHGQTLLSGGSDTTPDWTTVDGTQAACGTCHGLPPAGPHPAVAATDCSGCHPFTGTTPDDPATHIDGLVQLTLSCNSCHGSATNDAPPQDTLGNLATSAPGVGAHQSHVAGDTSWHRAVGCDDCHLVPAAVGDVGHTDTPLPAELTWGAVALADGSVPTFVAGSCDTYCHGQTLIAGGSETTPSWTTVDGSQAACGTCHGLPPAFPHVARSDCETCHPDAAAGLSFSAPAQHVDGIVDLVPLACNTCHGSATSNAPPVDTGGDALTTHAGVGAHQSHLGTNSWHRRLVCSDCHQVPAAWTDVGHLDTPLPAELTWGTLPVNDGATPTYSGGSCDNYCHGQTLIAGGADTTPVWTTVDGSQAACGNCHGLPPAYPHVPRTDCESCHPDAAAGQTFSTPSEHVDGTVQLVPLACNTCHGSASSDAPPVDAAGDTVTSDTGVGAHQSHLGASGWHREVVCADCHQVPTAWTDAGHVDTPLPAELTWGALAAADGATATWAAGSCDNYCHGQTLLTGGSDTTPAWTTVDGSQAACGTCHGLPPAGPHPAVDPADCSGCHPFTGTTPDAPASHIDGVVDLSLSCNSCHGSATNDAPPSDTNGNTATTDPGVGAHQSHVDGDTSWHAPIACEECHLVPAAYDDAGHLDSALPAETVWGSTATADGASPTYAGGDCTNYCHGETLGGGSETTPTWTTVDGSQAACGSCHGTPPPFPHANRSDCEACHPDAGPGMTFTDPASHVDGTVDLIGFACNSCHGSATSNAPPVDTTNGSATTLSGVGAHQSHLGASTWHRTIPCTDCHLLPGVYTDPGHIDTPLPAELTWAALPTADGATATWAAGSCDNYCHGQTLLGGGTNTTPAWTTVDGSQAACGTCHGLPPAFPHVARSDCESCHPDAAPGQTFSAPAQHVDGTVQLVPLACNTCHGSATSNAPPVDTSGASATTLSSVGAHQSHLGASTWHRTIPCADCHLVPAAWTDAGHVDTPLPAELSWAAVPTADGATATWAAGSCDNYCHGQTLLTGGTNTTPAWTTVDGSQAACGTCHGLPPAFPHVDRSDCESCHPDAAPGQTFSAPAQHVDGTVDLVPLACNTCHGDATSDAPPVDTGGATVTTDPGVGAHESHLTGSAWRADIACEECHLVPAVYTDAGHIDSDLPAELTWGTTAGADGATPSYAGGTCDNYCHGQTLTDGGGSDTTPDWTTVDGSQAACGTCHGLPPGGNHPTNPDCASCHPDAGPGLTITDSTQHVDGDVDLVPLLCNTCHGSATSDAPPVDTAGDVLTTDTGVGAHQSHLGSSTWHRPVICTDCHLVPSAWTDPGHMDTPLPAELTWGALPTGDGATATWAAGSCDNYCHGQTLMTGGTDTTPVWTTVNGTQAACGTCHGLPPDYPHVDRGDCQSCHPDAAAGLTFSTPAQHVDGTVQLVPLLCNTCHGSASSDAPPVDTAGDTLTSDTGVGAHQSHLGSSTWRAPIACDACHQVPTAYTDAGHMDTDLPAELSWGALPQADGAIPGWTGASCDNYCHGQTLISGGTNTTPVWTTVDGSQDACGTCHGLPPAFPHVGRSDCETCHPDAGAGQTIVNAVQHVNGTVELVPLLCNTCHGSAANDAPPVNTTGASLTTLTGVGAHQSHLGASAWHRTIPCSDCHLVPAAWTDAGHLDTPLPAELTWDAVPTADGAIPGWTGASCDNYCHGQTLMSGGTNTTPIWTTVNGTQAACGTCHGAPPAAPHVARTDCESCHPDAAPGQTFSAPAQHVDGTVQLSPMSCNSCHGSPTSDAPPVDTAGDSATNDPQVGAHQAHLVTGTSWRADIACTECHLVPASYTDAGHIDGDGVAETTWGATASADGASPSYSGGDCSNYCHGATLGGGSDTTPTWTTVDGTQDACGTCHGVAPPGPHPVVAPTDCSGCHPFTGTTPVDPQTHVDGTVDLLCESCHAYPPLPGSQDYAGGGGAHDLHFTTLGFGCATCHGHNGSGPTHDEGGGTVLQANVDVVFGATPVYPGGTTPTNGLSPSHTASANPTCRVGCHDPLPGDVAELNNVATWTDTTIGCNECHDEPGITLDTSHDHDPASTGDDLVIRASCQECHDVSNHASGTVAIVDPDPTDGFTYAATGLSGLCRTCHDGGAGTFFQGQTPPDKSSYWSIPCQHSVAGLDCESCHDRHGSAAGTMLVYREEDLCYGCHDGSVASTNLTTPFGRASHHPIVDSEQTGWEVECTSCHEVHVATTGLSPLESSLPGAVLYGSEGRVPQTVGGVWTSPSNYQPVTLTGAATDRQAFLCFKCHTPARSGYTGQDVGRDFNPNNPRYHAVWGASKATGLGTYVAPWDGASGMACTDCHASASGTDPAGAHGSDVSPLLKGLWNQNTGRTGNVTGHLCFNCHSPTVYGANCTNENGSASGFREAGGRNLHCRRHDNRPCAACHGMVPHGWKRPYPIATDQDGAPYEYPTSNYGMQSDSNMANWGPTNGWSENDCHNQIGSCG
ncbi:MAG: cytochrome c3 family protein [Deltaproteobacteria bacterium]|nr:cytochrome c3 family protein [Deltaproteobacteria bacterium]